MTHGLDTHDLLAVLDLALFERQVDGTFLPIGPLPAWFVSLSRDASFPFLGTFLEEANEFWMRTSRGRLASGLCAAADADGREFHFEATAIAVANRHLLLFEMPRGVDELRAVLQEAREEKLARTGLERLLELRTRALRTVHEEVHRGVAALDAEQPGADTEALRQMLARIDEAVIAARL